MTTEMKLREIATGAGLDPDVALGMTVRDFCQAIAIRRALRDSERIALSVLRRGARASEVRP